MSITTVEVMFPKFPSEIVSCVSMGDYGKSTTLGGEDRVYIFLYLFKRWKKRGPMMVIIPRYIVNAKNFHDRFFGWKDLRNVVKSRRQGI
jgi:hypothetical protein